MPKTLNELQSEEIHINKLKNILNGGISMECKEECNYATNDEKICPGCLETKNIDQYHRDKLSDDGHVKYCKTCVSKKRILALEEHAKDMFYHEVIPYSKIKPVFTIKDIWNRISSTKHKASNLLKVMVDLGLLTVTKKGVTNYYELAETEQKPEGQYNGLSEVLEEHQCSNICLDKPSKFMVYNKKGDDPDIQIQTMTDPITESDIKELEEIGVKFHEDIGRPYISPYQPEQTMLKLISSIYNKADEIKLVPISHEIHIKLKGA